MKRDKEVEQAVDIALLKKEVEDIKRENRQWRQLIKDTVKRIIALVLLSTGSGWFFGWHLPEPLRVALIKWLGE